MQPFALSVSAPTPKPAQPFVPGESFLKFQLTPQITAILPAQVVQEATVLSARRITAMPNMPACLLGLTNRRGQVFWVASLVRLLGLPLATRYRQQYSLVIIQVGTSPVALQVDAIEGIVSLPADAIQPPPVHTNSAVLPYLRGCVVHRNETLLLLDAEAILQSSELQSA
ncbi:MAG: chemotaxis protein CheW [Cyanobacteria bacterium J06648_16]